MELAVPQVRADRQPQHCTAQVQLSACWGTGEDKQANTFLSLLLPVCGKTQQWHGNLRPGRAASNWHGSPHDKLWVHTSCVVQMDPEPMPTLRASAPACMSRCAWAPVTTLPQMTWRSGVVFFRCWTISI